jgi:hypothetical protein
MPNKFRYILMGALVALTAAACGQDSAFNTPYMNYRAFDALPATEIKVGGSTILLAYAPGAEPALSKDEIAAWVKRCGQIVAAYYGRFPVEKYRLLVVTVPGNRMGGGTTWGFRGGATKLRLGQGVQMTQLDNDWVLIHEMIHLAFPEMNDRHHWIEEGLATYIESIARVQAGNLDSEIMWRSLVHGMPDGEPGFGDEGLDNTHSWGRTYWGGALFCFVADVSIRERTGNRMGLQDAMRGIVNAGGSIEEDDWSIEDAFRVADRATGTRVLQELYAQQGGNAVEVDLDALWQKLGVVMQDGKVVFSDKAPEADVRRAITAPH